MSSEKIEPLKPEDVVPGDPTTTIWRWCLRNGWTFIPDLTGGDAFVDVECAASMLGVSKKTMQNDYLEGVPRYSHCLLRLSELMRRKP